MFDIGWSELLVVAVVMIIVVGPKDLPGMLRTFGRTMNQVRRTANDFKRQFNEALEDAEAESGLKDTTDQIRSIGSINPVADVTKNIDDLKQAVTADDAEPPAKGGGKSKPDKSKSTGHVDDGKIKTSGSDAA